MQQVSRLCDASGLSLDKKITMLLAVQTLGSGVRSITSWVIAQTCPPICIPPDQLFASDLTSKPHGHDRQRTTHCSRSKQAGLLRRGFATWASRNELSIKALMDYVGWRDVQSALRASRPTRHSARGHAGAR
ncbi:hypothetical protein [Pseudomonas frederiksbergensis]|uniref:hypothetical protein n=1 Tax=Pseudomonas frederiksbergensis TaxID=104087 RepID=UPI003D992E35